MQKTIKELFKATELRPISGEDLQDKVLVLRPDRVKPQYHNRRSLLWLAEGGFGCSPTAMGRAVQATCIGDGEECRWNRSDFACIFTGDITSPAT